MKFFNVDLHISIIADMRKIFTDLGHQVDDWSLSDHTWVFNRERANIPMLDGGKWRTLSPKDMSDKFYAQYKDELSDYDAFIVTYPPPFALLFKHFNKPIIINNPIRYEWPFSFRKNDWEYFNEFLREGVDSGQIILVANNIYDQKYMEGFIERNVQHIPSICDYYGQYYEPTTNDFIYYSKGRVNDITLPNIKHKDQLFQGSHKHKDLTQFQGIIHFPYQISYMSIFEQYTANIPLFVPTKDFLIKLYKKGQPGILKEICWNGEFNLGGKSIIPFNGKYDPNDYKNFDAVYEWLQYADFYDTNWMPHILQFQSIAHLQHLVDETNMTEVSQNMKTFNEHRKNTIYNLWKNLIENKI